MQPPSLIRIIQVILAIALSIPTGIYWHFNQIGQNIINLTACLTLLAGLDNIFIYYRCYVQKSAFENEGTFVIFCLFMLGIIFENFNKSYGADLWVNQLCKYMLIGILVINGSYYITVLAILIAYFVRQIYRVMTETLLSPATVIQPRNLAAFIEKNKTSYENLHQRYPSINNMCSICLKQFQPNSQCVALPSCLHCFDVSCLSQWLNTKPSCPLCRHNIQLDIQLENH